MTLIDKVTIIISNYNSLHWLRIAVNQIRKHTKHPFHIIISEQSEDHYPVQAEYNGWNIITVVPLPPHSSGYGLDCILKTIPIETEYVCAMDVDTFPVSDDWLSLPIRLLNDYGLTWVGLRAEIESAYNLHYFHMGECYRIGRTKDFKLLAENAGWTQVKGDGFRDNAVNAHSWEDANFKNKKLSLPVTGRIGLTRSEGEYGRLIGNLAVHFCFAFTSSLHETPVKNMGEEYMQWEHKIKTLPPDEVVRQIMNAITPSNRLQPMQYWDGEDYAIPPRQLADDVTRSIRQGNGWHVSPGELSKRYGVMVRGVIHIGAGIGREFLNYIEDGIDNVIITEPYATQYNNLIREAPVHYGCYRVFIGPFNNVITIDVDDGLGILTTVSRLDDMAFNRGLFNFLYWDSIRNPFDIFLGARETLGDIDIIYCIGRPGAFDETEVVGFIRTEHYILSPETEIVIYTKR